MGNVVYRFFLLLLMILNNKYYNKTINYWNGEFNSIFGRTALLKQDETVLWTINRAAWYPYIMVKKFIIYKTLFLSSWMIFLLWVFTVWVPCCDVRYDFRIITMFGSPLLPGVYRRTHVLFTLFVFVYV